MSPPCAVDVFKQAMPAIQSGDVQALLTLCADDVVFEFLEPARRPPHSRPECEAVMSSGTMQSRRQHGRVLVTGATGTTGSRLTGPSAARAAQPYRKAS